MQHRITPWMQETEGINQNDNERLLKCSILHGLHDLFRDIYLSELFP